MFRLFLYCYEKSVLQKKNFISRMIKVIPDQAAEALF